MKPKYISIAFIAIGFAILHFRCCIMSTRWTSNNRNHLENHQSEQRTHSASAMNTNATSVNGRERFGLGIAKTQSVLARPVTKNGHLSVYFDYDRGLEKREKPWPMSHEIEKAETRGADFKLSFLIVDDKDKPVENADVTVVALKRLGSEVFSSKTGSDGIATIEGNGTGEIHVEIDKRGYFHTSLWHWIFDPHLECASNGRWLPWNPLIKVQLDEKPSNCSAIAYKSQFSFNGDIGMYGFDLLSGKASSSTNCDMLISVRDDPSAVSGKWPWHCFDLTFPGDGNGAQIVKKNLFSECPHPSIAPETGYTNLLRLSGWEPISDDEAVVFRIRNSESSSPLYGVFRSPFLASAIAHDFRFDVIVNVEYGSRTLLPASDHQPLTRFFTAMPLVSLSDELTQGCKERPCKDGKSREGEGIKERRIPHATRDDEWHQKQP